MDEETYRDEQIAAMRQGVAHKFPIKVGGFSVNLRPLTIDEQLEVAADVTEAMAKIPAKANNRLTEETFMAKLTLEKASTSSPQKNDPKLTSAVIGQMYADELHFLFKQYALICEKVNPMLEEMSVDAINELVEHLKKNDLQVTELSSLQLINLVRYLVTQVG